MGALEGQVALVTGAGRGIGLAIARRLAADGAAVMVNDLDAGLANEAAAELGGLAASGSVADPKVTDELVATAEREYGRLDVVVNNAGLTKDSSLHRMSDNDWDAVVDVVLRGAFNVCRSAARLLRDPAAAHHRKVVNISSINGIYGVAFNVNYSAAKAGLIGLTKALAREWAPLRINVNAVAPGFVAGTRLTAPRGPDDSLGIPQEALDRIVDQIPIGRPGTAADVAALVGWLSGPESDYVTGQVVEIHGGLEIVSVT